MSERYYQGSNIDISLRCKHTERVSNCFICQHLNLESQLLAVQKQNEKYKLALEEIERWCDAEKPSYVPSIFAKGCITPDAKTVLAENLGNIAKAALRDTREGDQE